mgnify:CR=1 FL=1
MDIKDHHQEILNTITLIHNFGLDFGSDLNGISRKSFLHKLYSNVSKNRIILQYYYTTVILQSRPINRYAKLASLMVSNRNDL